MKGDKVVERSKKLLHLAKKLYMQGLQYPHKVNIRLFLATFSLNCKLYHQHTLSYI